MRNLNQAKAALPAKFLRSRPLIHARSKRKLRKAERDLDGGKRRMRNWISEDEATVSLINSTTLFEINICFLVIAFIHRRDTRETVNRTTFL